MRVLHLGCGRKRIAPVVAGQVVEIVSLDMDPNVSPDLVCCLGKDPIPLPDDSLDGAVAIHVLEHIGKQGETAEWFQFWEELYRVLKPGGTFEFISPYWNSVWAWGDPTHVRVISTESLYFFNQDNYKSADSPISPFRVHCDFVQTHAQDIRQTSDGPIVNIAGVLTVRKPLKPWWENKDLVCHVSLA